jgi:hypothetical protein
MNSQGTHNKRTRVEDSESSDSEDLVGNTGKENRTSNYGRKIGRYDRNL